MNRINTSRQSVAAKQRDVNYKPNFAVAQHVADGMIECISREPIIEEEDGDFLVASKKFVNRYYRVWEEDGAWFCSSREQAFADMCIAKVQAFLLQRIA